MRMPERRLTQGTGMRRDGLPGFWRGFRVEVHLGFIFRLYEVLIVDFWQPVNVIESCLHVSDQTQKSQSQPELGGFQISRKNVQVSGCKPLNAWSGRALRA